MKGDLKQAMPENYLDVTKSVIISSPAGSGKTEKLARRYISLLSEGAEVEKILCITFTEKAAAEMKERILSILGKENPYILQHIRSKIPLMRISTIHAFCLKVLKRFSIELGIDPSLNVMDELTSRTLWNEAVFEHLMAQREKPDGIFLMIRDRGLKGWNSVKRQLDELHARSPYPEMLIKDEDSFGRLQGESLRLMEVYRECLLRYKRKKLEKHLLDFSDLEMLAYAALSLGPHAHNILYSFDEHTDHVLVDEFQDTSTLQWDIIDKLTEEWRAGMGAKRDSGKSPTIFLVGDEKQSIYLFRGANVSVFHEAKERFAHWLGSEYNFVEAKDNFRSLPVVVDFVNRLFQNLMPGAPADSWMTRYAPFEAVREGEGKVELVLLPAGESTKETRAREADALALTIKSLHSRHEVYEGGEKRPCSYADIAVLLRRRTHLGLFEDALRKEGIPFIVLKGIGFYEEPEIAMLREFISFVVDPSDDYSLFCLLRSPLFSADYKTLAGLISSRTPLLEKLKKSKNKRLSEAYSLIERWLSLRSSAPLPELIEKVFLDTGSWSCFWEKQRHANIKKFITVVEGFEARGMSHVEIREKLLRQRYARDEAKANINAEGMDAVRIMTIHAAKGLQFPMVFLPSLDENNAPRSGPIVMDDSGGRIALGYEEDSRKRNKDEMFRRQKQKEEEEEKRLFYVAVTRAMDYLCMISSPGDRAHNSRHGYLEDAFDLEDPASLPFSIVSGEELKARYKTRIAVPRAEETFMFPPAYVEPLSYEPARTWKDVTGEETVTIRRRHGENWLLTGNIMHRLFEELSKEYLHAEDISTRAERLLRGEVRDMDHVLTVIMEDMNRLRQSGIMEEIILPRKNSHAELPFVLEKGKHIYRGRIDRLLLRDNTALVYDYKTFPVKEREIPALLEEYGFQMQTYAEAARALFEMPVRAFLLFTHMPRSEEVLRLP